MIDVEIFAPKGPPVEAVFFDDLSKVDGIVEWGKSRGFEILKTADMGLVPFQGWPTFKIGKHYYYPRDSRADEGLFISSGSVGIGHFHVVPGTWIVRPLGTARVEGMSPEVFHYRYGGAL